MAGYMHQQHAAVAFIHVVCEYHAEVPCRSCCCYGDVKWILSLWRFFSTCADKNLWILHQLESTQYWFRATLQCSKLTRGFHPGDCHASNNHHHCLLMIAVETILAITILFCASLNLEKPVTSVEFLNWFGEFFNVDSASNKASTWWHEDFFFRLTKRGTEVCLIVMSMLQLHPPCQSPTPNGLAIWNPTTLAMHLHRIWAVKHHPDAAFTN